MTNIIFDSIKKIFNILTDIKGDINQIESNYEKMVKNLCLPFVLEISLIDINSTNDEKKI